MRFAKTIVGGVSKGAKPGVAVPETETKPKRNIARDIRRHKRSFDYGVFRTDGGKFFVVDAEVKLDRAVRLFLEFRPNEDPMSDYREGRVRFNVTSREYELVDGDAPTQGTFPVHIFRMED